MQLAEQTVVDLVRDFIATGDENECVNDGYANVSHYVASTTLPLEGIRAMVIDKDRKPMWQPATLEEVTTDMVDAMFAPLGENEWKAA